MLPAPFLSRNIGYADSSTHAESDASVVHVDALRFSLLSAARHLRQGCQEGKSFVFSKGPRPPKVSAARRSERGGGRLKALVFTAVLVFAVYATFKILPSYIAEYELHDKMQEAARFAVVYHYTEDQIKDNIYKVVQDLNIPAKREDIKVSSSTQIVKISMDYTVPVDLLVYRLDLHFTPSSENKSLLAGS